MQSPVQQIKERLSIVDVISSYITLEKAGANMRARCPFHNEKTPSFFISPVRQSYYCFGCGAKGDIFTFIESFEGIDFVGALKVLAERAGISLHYEEKKTRDARTRLYSCMDDASVFYEKQLKECVPAQSYVALRGISADTIKSFRIGYAPNDWRLASDYLKSLGYTDSELIEAGITKVSTNLSVGVEKRPYDRFRGRIMFPISDSSGRIIAFSGRILVDDDKSPKYLNSPDTPLYDKSNVFYGLDKAKLAMRTAGYAILVEGQIDLVLLHQYGFTNAIASSGTAVTEAMTDKSDNPTNFGVVKRLTGSIVLAFDGDKAGIKAASRTAMIALPLGIDISVVRLPNGMDPADVLRKDVVIWQNALKAREHIIPFLLGILIEKVKDPLVINKMLREKILPFIAILPSSIDQAHFVKLICEKTGIPIDAIYDEVKKIKIQKKDLVPIVTITPSKSEKEPTEEQLFAILFWQEKMQEPSIDIEKLRTDMAGLYDDQIIFSQVMQKYDSHRDELIFQAELLFQNGPPLTQTVAELVLNLNERMIRKKLNDIRIAQTDIQNRSDEKKMTELLDKSNQLSKQLEAITKRRFT